MAKKQSDGAEGPRKVYEVRLKPGHPTGTYHRDGKTFSAAPILIEEITAAIKTDPWLIVSAVPAPLMGEG